MESWEGTAFVALVFRECLNLVGRLEQRRLLGVVREADLKGCYMKAGYLGTPWVPMQGQLLFAVETGSGPGAKERDMGDLGRSPRPHSTQRRRLLTACGVDCVCFRFVTFQPGDRSRKPTTDLGGEDAGRPGQPGGETTPADRKSVV